jgi:hypothetical protein
MKQFNKGTLPDLKFKTAIKKPIPMCCCQIHEDFEVETAEGTMHGKAGDWLIVGVKGEMWSITDEVFRETYEITQDSSNTG